MLNYQRVLGALCTTRVKMFQWLPRNGYSFHHQTLGGYYLVYLINGETLEMVETPRAKKSGGNVRNISSPYKTLKQNKNTSLETHISTFWRTRSSGLCGIPNVWKFTAVPLNCFIRQSHGPDAWNSASGSSGSSASWHGCAQIWDTKVSKFLPRNRILCSPSKLPLGNPSVSRFEENPFWNQMGMSENGVYPQWNSHLETG